MDIADNTRRLAEALKLVGDEFVIVPKENFFALQAERDKYIEALKKVEYEIDHASPDELDSYMGEIEMIVQSALKEE